MNLKKTVMNIFSKKILLKLKKIVRKLLQLNNKLKKFKNRMIFLIYLKQICHKKKIKFILKIKMSILNNKIILKRFKKKSNQTYLIITNKIINRMLKK